MTRKDYELIASAFVASRPTIADDLTPWESGNLEQWRDCVDTLANSLRSQNPRFDHARFKRACGYFPREEAKQ